jgi:hypothetical protein
MSETTVNTTNNGNKATSSKVQNTSEDRAKASRKPRQLPSLPTAVSTSDMTQVQYTALVDKTPVEWSSLENYEMFSQAPDGSFPMMKISISKAVRIADKKVMMVGSGRCYRISLSNLLIAPQQ